MQPYFRDAVPSDLPAIAAILRSASHLGDLEDREQLGSYRDALAEIDRTDGNYLLVAEYDRQITALIQLVTIRHIHHSGGRTAQIVALHVAEPFRTTGIGAMLLEHTIERVRELGCGRLQALSSTASTDQHSFWERAGFVQLDRGYVRPLD